MFVRKHKEAEGERDHVLYRDAEGAGRIQGVIAKRKNGDGEKRGFLSKAASFAFQSRHFGIAGGLLSYGKTREALTMGDPAVFALRELVLVEPEGDNLIKLRFPERLLTLKYENEEQREVWLGVFTSEAARLGANINRDQAAVDADPKAQSSPPTAAPSDDDDDASAGTAADYPVFNDPPQSTGHRPPSPRSMLASGTATASAAAAAKWGTVDDYEEESPAKQAPIPAAPRAVQPPPAAVQPPPAAVQPPPAPALKKQAPPPRTPLEPAAVNIGAPKMRVVDAKTANAGDGDLLDNTVPVADANFLDDWDSD